jgi:CheY-like chemotaxis protein
MLLDSVLMAQGRDALSHRLRQTGDVAKDYMAQLAGAHVLLVEDNDINQELALELLQGAGIKVDVANHGREALEKLAETDYDGVLMDIQMPVMDGYTATERIREQERFAELPVIAMTANALVGDRERALEVGMNDHIAKPLNVSTMFATLARWITPSVPATVTDVAAGFQPDAELPALTGIDTRAGLATCGGNRNLYVKLLRKFRDANQDFDAQFAAAEADDDADAPRRLAHTLKGTSASIGAGEVSLSAAELEAVCRPGEEDAPVEARRRAVVRALEPVLAALGEAEWLEPAQDESAAGPGIDAGAMAELRNLLENADTRAGQEAESLAKAGSESQRVLLQAIIEQIELFDFDAALEALTTMEQQLEAMEVT